MTTKSMQLAECIDFDEVINIFAEKIKDQDEWNYEIAKVPIIIETLKHVSRGAH